MATEFYDQWILWLPNSMLNEFHGQNSTATEFRDHGNQQVP